jgi:ribokinase
MTTRPYVDTLVFVGGISADVRTWVHEHPDVDNEVAWGTEGRLSPGGRAASAAVGAVKLGRRFVDLVGCVGDDWLGDSLYDSLKDAGVSMRLVDKVDSVPTGIRQVVIDSKGERRTVGAPNANWHCGQQQLRKADSSIFGADLVYATLEVPLQTVERLVVTAAGRNVPVLLDVTPFPTPAGEDSLEKKILGNADVVLANWTAARKLAEMPEAVGPVALELAKRLLRSGPKAVVITLGEHGSMVAMRGKHALIEPYKTRVTDTSGAGDAYGAALAVGLTDQARGGWTWDQLLNAARFAAAASAVSVSKSGELDSLPTREEVERVMAVQVPKIRRS